MGIWPTCPPTRSVHHPTNLSFLWHSHLFMSLLHRWAHGPWTISLKIKKTRFEINPEQWFDYNVWKLWYNVNVSLFQQLARPKSRRRWTNLALMKMTTHSGNTSLMESAGSVITTSKYPPWITCYYSKLVTSLADLLLLQQFRALSHERLPSKIWTLIWNFVK